MTENFSGVKLPQGRPIFFGQDPVCAASTCIIIIDVPCQYFKSTYIVSREQYWSALHDIFILLLLLSYLVDLCIWPDCFSSMIGSAKIVAWNLLVDGWFCCWSWGRLWAISQGTPPPIKGMARPPVNHPTTNNNTETSKHAINSTCFLAIASWGYI